MRMAVWRRKSGLEAIMVHLIMMLFLCVGGLAAMLIFNAAMHHRMQAFVDLQERHHTIGHVGLIIGKQIARAQIGFQRVLLAVSPDDLGAAVDIVRASMDSVDRAVRFLEQGGVFVEDAGTASGTGGGSGHAFRLDAPAPDLDGVGNELRACLAALDRKLGEYHARAAGNQPGVIDRSGVPELAAMQEELTVFFGRITRRADELSARSMGAARGVLAELHRAEGLHDRMLTVALGASIVLQLLIGGVVMRSAARILADRANARRELESLNERLEERVAARTGELAVSEARLRNIALISGDIIWQTDATGRFVFLAGQHEKLLGVSLTEAPAMRLGECIADTREGRQVRETLLALHAATAPVVDLVCPLASRLDDRVRYFLINATPIPDGPGAGGYLGVSKDISEKREHEIRLRLLEKVFETVQEGITVTDATGNIMLVNPAFSTITGYAREEVVGQNPRLLKSEHHPPEFYETMWRSLNQDGFWTGELWNRRKSGEAYPEWLSITVVRDSGGDIANYVGVFRDITAMREKEEEILRMAYYDALTGLPNRTMLWEKFGVALLRAEKVSRCYLVLYVDLDNFKLVNDSLGHEAGDELLVEVGRRFQRLIRTDDVVARLGGDEFVFLFSLPLDECVEPLTYAERVQKALTAPVRIKGQDLFVTPSIGIARYPEDGDTIQALLKHADLAMYAAKSMGRNQSRLFEGEMTARASARLSLENRLRLALRRGEIFPLFQPKVSLGDGRIIGAEALARWATEDRRIVSPADFIPVAEETGLVVPLGMSMLVQSCRAMRTVGEQVGTPLKVAVNVSARQFRHDDFIDGVRAAVRDAGISFEQLELEITESVLLGDVARVGEILGVLSGLGAAISIDDFGTGYSSLSYLSRLPIDRIKIDRSFVLRLHGEASDAELLRAIIHMGKSLRMRVLAEGVETKADADLLAAMGCDEAQGYYFGKPMPPHELIVAVKRSWLA